MGCSASVSPALIQSITKVDVGTNTTDNESSSSATSIVEPVKQLIEESTQSDDLQIDVKTNLSKLSEENTNEDFYLKNGDPLRVLNNEKKSRESIDDHINPRFHQDFDDAEELAWTLYGMDANQFCISNQYLYMYAGQVTPTMVVDAMEKTNDSNVVTKAVWNLLYQAKKTDDATYLIRAYTAESNFYKILNRRLARQSLGNPADMTLGGQLGSMMGDVFTQLNQAMSSLQGFLAGQPMQLGNNTETDWAKLYLQAVYRLIMIPNSILRYEGRTYRGMRLTLEELEQYECKSFVSNKAITSTSKLRHIAQTFIDSGPRPEDMIDVMFVYVVESYSALLAIDVHTFSLIPHEEEVLIMPGILFSVGEWKVISPTSVEIEMRSAFQELANGGLANALTGLLSGLETDPD